jgi:hypothetical protein
MPGFDGTGPEGRGAMTGGARGYCNPRGTVFSFQRTYPRRMMPNYNPYHRDFGFDRFASRPNREEVLGFLKNEVRSLSDELKALEAKIKALETGS